MSNAHHILTVTADQLKIGDTVRIEDEDYVVASVQKVALGYGDVTPENSGVRIEYTEPYCSDVLANKREVTIVC